MATFLPGLSSPRPPILALFPLDAPTCRPVLTLDRGQDQNGGERVNGGGSRLAGRGWPPSHLPSWLPSWPPPLRSSSNNGHLGRKHILSELKSPQLVFF
jgi:hypothetical protein